MAQKIRLHHFWRNDRSWRCDRRRRTSNTGVYRLQRQRSASFRRRTVYRRGDRPVLGMKYFKYGTYQQQANNGRKRVKMLFKPERRRAVYRHYRKISSVIPAAFVGCVPGAPGAVHRQRRTYDQKLSGSSDSFGKGDIRGVAAPGGKQHTSACGSASSRARRWALPGSGTTA